MKQLAMKLPTWGGKRKGAGRKPKGEKAGVPHRRRPQFTARHPVHVTLRLLSGVGFLRAFSRKRAIEDALRAARERLGMRVVHYSTQGQHLHLIVEADEPSALSRAIQGALLRRPQRGDHVLPPSPAARRSVGTDCDVSRVRVLDLCLAVEALPQPGR